MLTDNILETESAFQFGSGGSHREQVVTGIHWFSTKPEFPRAGSTQAVMDGMWILYCFNVDLKTFIIVVVTGNLILSLILRYVGVCKVVMLTGMQYFH